MGGDGGGVNGTSWAPRRLTCTSSAKPAAQWTPRHPAHQQAMQLHSWCDIYSPAWPYNSKGLESAQRPISIQKGLDQLGKQVPIRLVYVAAAHSGKTHPLYAIPVPPSPRPSWKCWDCPSSTPAPNRTVSAISLLPAYSPAYTASVRSSRIMGLVPISTITANWILHQVFNLQDLR
jgi:hypothetical protein